MSRVGATVEPGTPSAPRWTPPMPPVAWTAMPAACAAIIVAETVVAASPGQRAGPRRGSAATPSGPTPPGPSRTPPAPSASSRPARRPFMTATVAGTAPDSRTAASEASATSRFAGYGRPWLISVDSRATTPWPSASAAATSGRMTRRSLNIAVKRSHSPVPRRGASGHRAVPGRTPPATLTAAMAHRPDRPPMTPADIRRQVVVEELDLSRDGTTAVVVRRTIHGIRYHGTLLAVPLGRPRRGDRPAAGPDQRRRPRHAPADLARRADRRLRPDRPRRRRRARDPAADRHRRRPGAHRPARPPRRGRRDRLVAGRDPHRVHRGGRPAALARRAGRPRRDDRQGQPSRPPDRPHRLALGRGRPPRPLVAPVGRRTSSAAPCRGRSRAATGASATSPGIPTGGPWSSPAIAARTRTSRRGPRSGRWTWTRPASRGPREPREILAPGGWATKPAVSPDGRWVAAIGVLETEPLDDISPTVLVAPADGSRAGRAGRPRPGPRPADRQLDRQRPDRLDGLGAARPRSGSTRRRSSRRSRTAAGRDRTCSRSTRAAGRPATGRPSPATSSRTRSRPARAAPTARRRSPISRRTARARWSSPRSSCPATSRGGGRRIGSAWQDRFAPIEMRLVQAPGAGGPIDVWMATLAGAADDRLPTVVDVHGGPLGAWAPSPHVEVDPPRVGGLPGRAPQHPRLGHVRPRLDPAAARRLGRRRCRRRPRRGRPRHRARARRPRSAGDPGPELRRVHGQLDGRHDRPLPGGRLRQRRHQPDQRVGQLRLRPRVRPDGR